MGIVGLLISRGVRFMADGLNGPTNEEARKLLEIRLEEAQARHAEDLERLGREMSEVVAQPLLARLDVARRVERDVRTALCASMSECTDVAARRVAGERDLARAERDMYRNAAQGEVAMMREAARGRDATIETLRTQQEEQAEEVATLQARVAELEAIAREAESQANDMVSQKIAALGMAVNGAADEEAVSPDVQVVRGDFVMTKFRERLARIEAASPPAPQGLPVATDEELREAYITAITGAESPAAVLPHALRAVAARVRAERPACLVARAVALGVDVRVAEDRCGWLVGMLESADLDEEILHNVPAADVPATLARMLGEVGA